MAQSSQPFSDEDNGMNQKSQEMNTAPVYFSFYISYVSNEVEASDLYLHHLPLSPVNKYIINIGKKKKQGGFTKILAFNYK